MIKLAKEKKLKIVLRVIKNICVPMCLTDIPLLFVKYDRNEKFYVV